MNAMNLAIINSGYNSPSKEEGKYFPKQLIKINGEYLIERIIRLAGQSGLKKAICLINEGEHELKNYLLTKDLGIQLKLIVKDSASALHSLFLLAPYLADEPFCLATTECIFDENEFTEFISYSNLQNEADGALAVTRYFNNEKPVCVAMNEDDTIFKFSDSTDGYNWALGGICVLSPKIFDEMQNALDEGITRLWNFFRLLIQHGYRLKGFSFSKIIEVKHIADLGKIENFIKSPGI